MDLGEIIRTYRERHRYSRAQLADDLGVSGQMVSQIEAGVAPMPPDRVALLKNTHPELWEALAQAMLDEFAHRLGMSDEEIPHIERPLTPEEIATAMRVLERMRRQQAR